MTIYSDKINKELTNLFYFIAFVRQLFLVLIGKGANSVFGFWPLGDITSF